METQTDRTILNVQIFTTILVKLKMIDYYSYFSKQPMADEKLNFLSIELSEVLGTCWERGDISQEQWQELCNLSELAHDDSKRQSDSFWHREVAAILGMKEDKTWKPRRLLTRNELVTRLQVIRCFVSEDVPPAKNLEYRRFFGFIEGLEYMRLFNEAQRNALLKLAKRAAGIYSEPLPEGEALDNAVADIMAGRLEG